MDGRNGIRSAYRQMANGILTYDTNAKTSGVTHLDKVEALVPAPAIGALDEVLAILPVMMPLVACLYGRNRTINPAFQTLMGVLLSVWAVSCLLGRMLRDAAGCCVLFGWVFRHSELSWR